MVKLIYQEHIHSSAFTENIDFINDIYQSHRLPKVKSTQVLQFYLNSLS